MIKWGQGRGFDLCRGQLALFYSAAKNLTLNVFNHLEVPVVHMGVNTEVFAQSKKFIWVKKRRLVWVMQTWVQIPALLLSGYGIQVS